MNRPCEFCGTPFKVDESIRNWQHVKLCSDACRKAVAAQTKRASYTPRVIQRKDCLQCGDSFLPAENIGARQKFCSRKCFLEKRAAESHEQWSDALRKKTCAQCGTEYLPKKFGGGKQIYCSIPCQVSAINARRPAYKRASPKRRKEFKVMRQVVIERDKKCVICGSGKSIHVHHWDNSGQTRKCDNTLSNLAVLCGRCHRDIHSVTLVKIGGNWAVNGNIFKKLKLAEPVPIR